MIEKILVPTDGSQHSDRAVNYAIDLAKKYSSKIYLIHVISSTASIITGVDDLEPTLIVDIRKHREENGQQVLASALAKVEKESIEASSQLEYGNPAEKIVQTAQEGEFDLIVIGSRGLGSLSRFLLGSVSNKVTHQATCPVLIVH